MIQSLLCKLFSIVYHKYLIDNSKYCNTVIKVKGWRTALVENKWGQRRTDIIMFLWFT